MKRWSRPLIAGAVLVLSVNAAIDAGQTTLGITADGKYFTINGVPTYLNGVSYYGAGTITTTSFRTDDLNDMVADGFNWIRVWGHWKTDDGEDASALTHDGQVREPYMTRLKTLITECDSRGMIVDVTLNRDANKIWVGAWNQSEHITCVQTLASQLLAYRNVYFDVSNERNVLDGRYVSLSQVGQLIDAVKAIDPGRICTASSNASSASELADHRNVAHMDFFAPHLCRDAGCSAQTISTVGQFITWMNNLGWRFPVHLQEPFRRAYGGYNPVEDDFLRDCNGGKLAVAGGWCLHNERCFDMDNAHGRMYTQFDSVETNVSNWLGAHIAGNDVLALRYQPEYDEQLYKQIGRSDSGGRSANVAQDPAGYLTYGPYTTAFPADTYQATWRMLVDNNTANNDAVVIIDVYDPDGGGIRATRTITRMEFTAAWTYQDFTLTFTHVNSAHRLEFRTYWMDTSYLRVDYIDVRKQSTPIAPVINEVTPDPDQAYVGTQYTKQLTLSQGYPAPTWSVVAAPSGLTVSSSGYVSGWVPTAQQAGNTFTITIRATNAQGYDDESWDVNVTNLIATYEGGSGLSHLCGSAISGDSWRVTVATNYCWMAYGPYTTSLPAGALTARFWLRVDNNTADDANICQIDVNDADGGILAGPLTISRMDWTQANVYQPFDLQFNNPGGGHRIEFRTYYLWYSQLDLDKVEVLGAGGGGGGPVTISSSTFASSADGWTIGTWRAGQYSDGTMAFDGSTGNPAGSMKSTGSGSTNNTDSCTREGGEIKKAISTAGYASIQVKYDLRFSTNQTGTTCSGGCTSTVLEGDCADKLAVYYSTAGTSGPWTLLEQVYASSVTQGVFNTRTLNLPSGANNQANFALRFIFQFNTSSDVGYLDNIQVIGTAQ